MRPNGARAAKSRSARRLARPWLDHLQGPESGSALTPAATWTYAEAEAVFGDDALHWGLATARAMTQSIVDAAPEFAGWEGSSDPVRIGPEAYVWRAMLMLAHDDLSIEGESPETTVGVHDFVRRGMPIHVVLHGLQLGHAYVLRSFLRACESLAPGPDAAREMGAIADRLTSFFDAFFQKMSTEYSAERERWEAGGGATRGQIVRSILREEAFDRRAAEFTLGYDLAGLHVACVIESDEQAHDDPSELIRDTSHMLRRLGCDGALTLPVDTRRLWAWGSFLHADPSAELVATEPPAAGLRATYGRPAVGVDGFRRSHQQAMLAARATHGTARPVVHYSEVDLPCLLGVDHALCEDFVARELGRLAGSDPTLTELRRTLRVYLDEGRSVTRAAERLVVARNTVSYRVRKAEGLRGRPIAERQLELHAALRVADLG